MKWKKSDGIRFHQTLGQYRDSPIGKVNFSISGGGMLAFVEKDGVRDQFRLTPQEMLVGLMEHYGVPVPSKDKDKEARR